MEQDGKFRRLVEDDGLNSKRVLDVTAYDGTVYAATDGYGVYEIRGHKITQVYTKKQGLSSGVVMKLVPSERLQGAWFVAGEELYFVKNSKYGGVPQPQRAANIGIANSLDMLLLDDGDAVILAGNGLFKIIEADLLEEAPTAYIHLTRRDGLPIDFTANAENTVDDGVLYLCGTMGAASADLTARPPQRAVRLYLKGVTADGQPLEIQNGETFTLSEKASRVTFDVRLIDYVHQNLYVSYELEGVDREETYLDNDDIQEVSYTNLDGGDYIYHYRVYEGDSAKCIAQLDVPLHKSYSFWEEPSARRLILLAVIAAWLLVVIIVVTRAERTIQNRYDARLTEETNAELAKLAYTDLVTGSYNRNWFEQERERLDMGSVYAFFSVSVDHQEYIRNKYGNFYFEGVLRKAAETMRECGGQQTELFRVSENVFYFWVTQPVELEQYVLALKERFRARQEDGVPFSLSVGAVYNNTVDKERVMDLIERCEKMRLLDEKHAEATFIEGKMKLL